MHSFIGNKGDKHGRLLYRETRIEEYEKIGKLLANSFLDYPFLTIITDDLKKPDTYPSFVEPLQTLLTRVYIKKGHCLIAEQDGELLAVALLQQKDFCILSIYKMAAKKLFATFNHEIFLNTLTL